MSDLPERLERLAAALLSSTEFSKYARTVQEAAIELRRDVQGERVAIPTEPPEEWLREIVNGFTRTSGITIPKMRSAYRDLVRLAQQSEVGDGS